MKKYLPHITFLFILGIVFFSPLSPFGAATAHALPGLSLLTGTLNDILFGIGSVILELASLLLGMSGVLLNLAVDFSVKNMGAHVAGITAIGDAWTIFRDVANMLFIFVILYIAISTILRANTHAMMQMLGKLIIAALLINFSFFFARVIIDASNILALGFYDKFEAVSYDDDGVRLSKSVSLSDAITQPLRIVTLFSPDAKDKDAFRQVLANSYGGGFIITIMGSIFLVIVAFVFFIMAALFAVRFGMLVLLMILSPIAFVGMVVPYLKTYADQWWKTLINQAFFAPVFFIIMFLVIKIINSPNFFNATIPSTSPDKFVSALSSPNSAVMNVVLNYVVVLVFVIAALVISKKMAKEGSGGAVDFATKFAGGTAFGISAKFGRKFIGGTAHWAAGKKGMQDWASRSGVGTLALKSLKGVAGSSFDARQTRAMKTIAGVSGTDIGKGKGKAYSKIFEEKIKKRQKFAQSLGEGEVKVRDKKKQREAEKAYDEIINKEFEVQKELKQAKEEERRATPGHEKQLAAEKRRALEVELENFGGQREGALKNIEEAKKEVTVVSRQEAYADRMPSIFDAMTLNRTLGKAAANKIRKEAQDKRRKSMRPAYQKQLRILRRRLETEKPTGREREKILDEIERIEDELNKIEMQRDAALSSIFDKVSNQGGGEKKKEKNGDKES